MNESFGLITKNAQPVPLKGVKVEGDILGRGAKIRVSQKYRNEEKKAVEAIYKYPLPEGSAVSGFMVQIGDRVIHGGMEERDKAFEKYDEALIRGDGGYLLEEERPNIFTLSVGNLTPGMEVVVAMDLVMLLDLEGTKYRLTLPTTISPRYIPAHLEEADGIPESDKLHPPYAEKVPYGMSMLLRIHHTENLSSIESPTHPVKVNFSRDPVEVTFPVQTVRMDRDFILLVDAREGMINRAFRTQIDGFTYVQLDLLPSVTALSEFSENKPKEILFLLDCSGSMSGDSIQEAKTALEICLRALKPGWGFNVFRFGSSSNSFFDRSVTYSENSLNLALQELKKTKADLGGTELLPLLTKVTASAPGSWERVILLLTDGEVGNEQEILNQVRRYQKNTRFFSLGIGSGPNEHLIKALARVGKGASEFVFPGERIEPKILRIYKKMMDPVLDDPEIYWGTDEIEQTPQLPALFLDTPTTVFARFKDDFWAESKIKLKASLQGREAEWEFKVVDGAAREIPIPLLWARERIRELEESLEGFDVPGSGRTGGKSSDQRAEIISLSEEFGLLSSLTSLIAVEERKEKATGEIILRKVPALVTIGWHGSGSVRDTQVNFCRLLPANDQPEVGLFQESIPRDFSSFKKVPINQVDHSKIQTTDIVLAILSLQRADGGFNLDRPIAKLLRMDFDKIRIAAFDISVSTTADKFTLLTTAILLEVLEIYFKEQEEMWRGLAEKSQNWLDSCYQVGRPSIYGKDFKSWVRRYVRDEVNPVR